MSVLFARLDNDGDVLLTGPAVRAVAASTGRGVTFACRPSSSEAARLLPGVERVITFEAAWIASPPPPVDPAVVAAFIQAVAALGVDEALVMTSWHQSPLPLALLLRLAGVPVVAAISEDYPGSLLDVRHRVDDTIHEVERNLSLAAAAGYRLPIGDDGRLAVDLPAGRRTPDLPGQYVVVHPGASVAARALPPELARAAVELLAGTGHCVVVTGGPTEWAARWPWPRGVVNLAGRTDLAGLGLVLAGADALVVGNTGPAHLAAAVGTPVVSVYAPTVPVERWHPWLVPHVVLGDQDISCRHCASRSCPFLGQPCTAAVTAADIGGAVDHLVSRGGRRAPVSVVA